MLSQNMRREFKPIVFKYDHTLYLWKVEVSKNRTDYLGSTETPLPVYVCEKCIYRTGKVGVW